MTNFQEDLPAVTNVQVPDGIYSVKPLKVLTYRTLVVEISTTGPYKGQRFMVKMLPFHLKVAGDKAELVPGFKPYEDKK